MCIRDRLSAPLEIPQATDPWQPYRYARPTWAWARTYAAPGSSRVVRSLAAGTYLAITAEAAVHDDLWYRTAGQDWIPASAVTLFRPSTLRGVELSGAAPPPPPPPPATRRGVVTATTLNVRARPGVAADNPPIDRLQAGAQVSILEQATVNGAGWYRIGERRRVHSGWGRLLPRRKGAGRGNGGSPPVGWGGANAPNGHRAPGPGGRGGP